MKNITTDDFRFGMFTFGFVISILIGCITFGVVNGSNNNHNFDVACVDSGKKLTYITLEGVDYAKKVCQ